MGRGKAWDIDENAMLARAWISASEDPVAGKDQRSKLFHETIHRRFSEKCPPSCAGVEGKYGLRTAGSIRNHISDLSADAQKFSKTLRTVRACEPTGVTENQILSMAVEVHVNKCATMNYEHKDYGHHNWVGFKAWDLWKNHPKWTAPAATTGTAGSSSGESSASGESMSNEQPTVSEGTLEAGTSEAEGARNRAPANGAEERLGLGTKSAKLVRQEELRTKAVHSMAESAKRKSDALEERNAIAAFSRPEADGMPETAQFFAALRRNYLAQALKRARVTSADIAAASSTQKAEGGSQEEIHEGSETQSEPATGASE